MKVAVVGATGLVGRKMIEVLSERNFPVEELIPVASSKSVGTFLSFKEKKIKVIDIQQAIERQPDLALFSAGSEVSRKYAPKFAEKGSYVIDNSSAWRMEKNIKLIVPEINGDLLTSKDKIIANPNCSTIQMVMVLYPLHKHYGIERIIVSTYQSVTGSGYNALEQLWSEQNNERPAHMFYPYQIHMNVLPHCDVFLDNGYTKEEMKLVNETKKILNDDKIMISATAVRVPVVGGHSESVNVELKTEFNLDQIYSLLEEMPGVILMDKPSENIYPMPIIAHNKDEVFVGRIRRDISNPKALNLWIVADNLRKGAATNAVQIAEIVLKNFLLH